MQALKELEEKSSGHYYNQASIVQYWCRDHNSEQLIHYRKSSTDQEHICYMVAMVRPCCPSVRAQLFFQTGCRVGGPEARVAPARPVLQQQRRPHCISNATAGKIKSDAHQLIRAKNTRCKIDWGSEDGK